jgi:Carboxypeptidase regulatory-like domain
VQELTGERNAVTPTSGSYDIPELPVGTYTVTITHASLQPAKFEKVTVAIEHTTILNVVLRVFRPVENVEVTDSDQFGQIA